MITRYNLKIYRNGELYYKKIWLNWNELVRAKIHAFMTCFEETTDKMEAIELNEGKEYRILYDWEY